MNEERILELADYVEGLEHKVDLSGDKLKLHQARPFHMDHCKQCLIGQTGVLFASSLVPVTQFWSSPYAEEVLGLDTIGNQLFFPSIYAIETPGNILDHITPQVAASVLRNLMMTGRVEWPQKNFEEFCQSESHHSFSLS